MPKELLIVQYEFLPVPEATQDRAKDKAMRAVALNPRKQKRDAWVLELIHPLPQLPFRQIEETVPQETSRNPHSLSSPFPMESLVYIP